MRGGFGISRRPGAEDVHPRIRSVSAGQDLHEAVHVRPARGRGVPRTEPALAILDARGVQLLRGFATEAISAGLDDSRNCVVVHGRSP